MRLYDDEMLQQINDNVNLLEYVSHSIEMVKRGSDYFGHCPLHVDNTPSFSVTPSKNKYYCFSCGKAGGIIKFLMDYEDLDFESAVEKAASLANLDLSKMCQSQTISFLKKLRSLSFCTTEKYDHPILPEADYLKYSKEPAWEWLNEGIQQEVLDLFDVRIDNHYNRII